VCSISFFLALCCLDFTEKTRIIAVFCIHVKGEPLFIVKICALHTSCLAIIYYARMSTVKL